MDGFAAVTYDSRKPVVRLGENLQLSGGTGHHYQHSLAPGGRLSWLGSGNLGLAREGGSNKIDTYAGQVTTYEVMIHQLRKRSS